MLYFHRKCAAAFPFHAEKGIPRIFTGNCLSLEHLTFAFAMAQKIETRRRHDMSMNPFKKKLGRQEMKKQKISPLRLKRNSINSKFFTR
jgi:hypothetical protein